MKSAIVYVCGEDFFAPSLISCQSFDWSQTLNIDKYIFICTDNDDFFSKACLYCEKNEPEVIIKKMDISNAKNFSIMPHLHFAAYGRLFLHDYLDLSYDRILYLDGDSLSGGGRVNFETDLGGKIIGAVHDIGVIREGVAAQLLNLPEDMNAKYFNAGVLLIDWKLWCKNSIGMRSIEYLKAHPKIQYGDQCALNNVLINQWTDLHPSWNTQTDFFPEKILTKNAKIFHFTGAAKPWQSDLWKHDKIFTNYYKKKLKGHSFDTVFRSETLRSKISRVLRKIGGKKKSNWSSWVNTNYGDIDKI